MPAKEVLEFYNLKGISGYFIYGFRFLRNFMLDKMAFFCPIKSWRTQFHRWKGIKIGKGVYIGHEVIFDRIFPDQIEIGDYTSIGDRSIITAHANIPSDTPLKKIYPRSIKKTVIGNGVWIMPNVTIIPGVQIGDESVIATGSVVTKNVESNTLVAGVPARFIKKFNSDLV